MAGPAPFISQKGAGQPRLVLYPDVGAPTPHDPVQALPWDADLGSRGRLVDAPAVDRGVEGLFQPLVVVRAVETTGIAQHPRECRGKRTGHGLIPVARRDFAVGIAGIDPVLRRKRRLGSGHVWR